MCSPAMAAGAQAGLNMVGNVMNYFAIQSAHHAAVQAANLNFNMKSQQVGQENVQLSEQQSQTSLSDAVKQAQDFGRIASSAGALGLGASSSHQLLSTDAAAYNRTMGIEDTNYANKRANLQTDLTGASIQRSTEISNAPHTNLGVLALSLGKSAVGGAITYGELGGRYGMTPVGGQGIQSPPGQNPDGSMFFG